MNTFTRYATPILLAGTTILALTFYNNSQKANQAVQEKEADIQVLQTSIEDVQDSYNAALDENIIIVNENSELKERIAVLTKQIKGLRWKVKQQDKSIKEYKLQLEKLQKELDQKIARLAILDASDDTKIQAIKDLAAEKDHLQSSVDNLTKMLDQEIDGQKETKLELVASKLREEKIAALKDVIFNTKVQYISINPSKKEHGKELRKIRKSGKKWKFTNISFDMSSPDMASLEGKEFELKIINITTGEPVAYIESNPMYPDSEFNTTGVKFTYEGKPMTIVHTNNDLKVGQNYRAEISLVSDGQTYPLIHGDQAFIVNKKTLKNK